MASMSRYAEEDSNQKYLQLRCSVRFSTRPKIAFSHFKIKGNGGFFFSDAEQQENIHTGQRGEHQEEAFPRLQAQHWQTGQAGDIRGHQKEV